MTRRGDAGPSPRFEGSRAGDAGGFFFFGVEGASCSGAAAGSGSAKRPASAVRPRTASRNVVCVSFAFRSKRRASGVASHEGLDLRGNPTAR